MKKREQFKGIIRFWAAAILVLLQTGLFAYVWYACYGKLGVLFAMRGNFVLIGLHALMIYFFLKVYGSVKLGQIPVRKMLYSQYVSIICVNVITYLQLLLITEWEIFEHVMPMVYLTIGDILLVTLWLVIASWIYSKLYPPKQMLVIYGERKPQRLIRVLEGKKEKYKICETISCNVGLDAVIDRVNQYDNVLVCDIESTMREEILKHCFNESISGRGSWESGSRDPSETPDGAAPPPDDPPPRPRVERVVDPFPV